jgi:hypothetical protein
MAHAMTSTTATPQPTNTTESDAATHSGTLHAEQVPAQVQVASISGLENSPVGRLPPELRNEILSLALTPSDSYELDSYSTCMSSFFSKYDIRPSTACSKIYSALNILATCKQIRFEAGNLFFSLNDIKVVGYGLQHSVEEVERLSPLLKTLPYSLDLDLERIILPV